jgi:hypothetical protein
VIIGAPYHDNVPFGSTDVKIGKEKKNGRTEKENLGSTQGQGSSYIFTVGLAPMTSGVTLGGRVTDGGRALNGVTVIVTEQNGNVLFARTNPFGYFRFTNVESPQTLLVTAYSKEYVFSPRLVNLNGDLTGLEIIGSPVSGLQQIKR